MTKSFWLSLAIVGLTGFLPACSSIKKKALSFYLGRFQDQKAEEIHFIPPSAPYKKQSHPVLDGFYWNALTKSSISYFSNCSKVQKTLEEFQKDSFPQTTPYKLLKQLKDKNGLYSILQISNSSQAVYSGVWTIRQKKCLFNINLVAGSLISFEKEEPVFKKFVKSFRSQ